jgi:hypothetical protein
MYCDRVEVLSRGEVMYTNAMKNSDSQDKRQ